VHESDHLKPSPLIRTKKLMETPKVECGSVIFNLTKKTLELVECLGFQQQQQ